MFDTTAWTLLSLRFLLSEYNEPPKTMKSAIVALALGVAGVNAFVAPNAVLRSVSRSSSQVRTAVSDRLVCFELFGLRLKVRETERTRH